MRQHGRLIGASRVLTVLPERALGLVTTPDLTLIVFDDAESGRR